MNILAPKNIVVTSIVVSFFLSGCHSLKAPSKPDDLWEVPGWEKSSKDFDSVWWDIQNRKETFDSSRSLTLIELIDMALVNNPSTREAWHAARAKQAVKAQAMSEWYPLVTFTADLTRDRKTAHPAGGSSNTRSYGGNLNGSLVVLDFGGRAASLSSAYHNVLAANFDFNQAVQDLILEVESAYYNFYTAEASLEAAEDNVEDAKAAYDAAEERLQVGIATRLDSLQAKSNYDESLFEMEEAKGTLETARADLAEALGLPADTKFRVAPPSWKIPQCLSEEDISRLIEDALSRRPDIASSRATLKAKAASVRDKFSDLLPSLSVGGAATRDFTDTFGAGSKTSSRYHEYSGLLKVTWDAFDGFKNYAEMVEAREAAKQQEKQLMMDELAASSDVWTKYYTFKTAVCKHDFSKAFLASSEESYDLALESYRAGLKSILDLLNAQSDLSDARSKLIQSKNDLLVALAELAHSTGSLSREGSAKFLVPEDN